MAYNRKNKLLHMQQVIDTYNMHKQPGVSTAYVYRTFIYPVYHISIATLYNYLSTPIKKQLRQFNHKQMELF